MRPGEKLYEELLADADTTLATAVPALRLARRDSRSIHLDDMPALLQSQLPAVREGIALRRLVTRLVPEYRADEPG